MRIKELSDSGHAAGKESVQHNNSAKLSQPCTAITGRNGFACALEKQLVAFPFLTVLSGDAGAGGR